MNEDFKTQVWQMVKRQGLSFVLILGLAYIFWAENQDLRKQIISNNEEIKAYYKTDNAEMREVVKRSNEVIERNNRIFESFFLSEKPAKLAKRVFVDKEEETEK